MPPKTMNQLDLAEFFGVDRSSVHAWQRQGLPCIKAGRGKQNAYIPRLAALWRIGKRVLSRPEWKDAASTPVDVIAVGAAAVALLDGRGPYTAETVARDLEACGVVGASAYPVRAAYWSGALAEHTGQLEPS